MRGAALRGDEESKFKSMPLADCVSLRVALPDNFNRIWPAVPLPGRVGSWIVTYQLELWHPLAQSSDDEAHQARLRMH